MKKTKVNDGLTELIAAARAARANAYAPYSEYRVGAAVRTKSGKIFAGCNVENASYGGCICAERGALCQMVASGEKEPTVCVVVTSGPVAASPCGICRQFLAEFARDMRIVLVAEEPKPKVTETTLATLLPMAFGGGQLPKQRRASAVKKRSARG